MDRNMPWNLLKGHEQHCPAIHLAARGTNRFTGLARYTGCCAWFTLKQQSMRKAKVLTMHFICFHSFTFLARRSP